MRFECNGSDLATAAENLTEILDKRRKEEGDIFLRAEIGGDEVELCAVNRQTGVSMRTAIPATVEEPGQFAVNGIALAAFAGKMRSGSLTIHTRRDSMTLAQRGANVRMQGNAERQAPSVAPLGEHGKTIRMKAADFRDCLDRVRYAADHDVNAARLMLRGVLMEKSGEGVLRMVASDGTRLALRETDAEADDGAKLLIQENIAGTIAGIGMQAGVEGLTLETNGQRCVAALGGYVISFPLIGSPYFDYANVIPKRFATEAMVNAQELRGAVERASVIARAGKGRTVDFRFDEDGVTLSAEEVLGSASEHVRGDVLGNPQETAAKADYLLEALARVKDGSVMLSMDAPRRPIQLREMFGDHQALHIIMPVSTR